MCRAIQYSSLLELNASLTTQVSQLEKQLKEKESVGHEKAMQQANLLIAQLKGSIKEKDKEIERLGELNVGSLLFSSLLH